MQLIEESKGIKPSFIIITGDGRRELHVLRGLTKVYNGDEITLFFPFSPIPKKTGKTALDSVKIIPSLYGISSIIYIVDGEAFNNSFFNEIQEYLISIGIEIISVNPIQNAILIKCKYGSINITLYCIISGPKTFIEEEIVRFIELTLHVTIDLSGIRNATWRRRVKADVNHVLKEKGIKRLEKLIETTGRRKLETSFPNICAVLKEIENKFR